MGATIEVIGPVFGQGATRERRTMARTINPKDFDEIKTDLKAISRLLSDARVQSEMIFGMVKAAQEHRAILHAEILDVKAKVLAQNSRIHTLEEWKNKAEGAIMGSRWTLALITAIAGMAGGTSLGLFVK
jgi:hypothetical protein